MKKFILAMLAGGLVHGAALAQTTPGQQQEQQDQQPNQTPQGQQQQNQRQGQQQTQPAPAPPATVTPSPAPLRPAPMRPATLRPPTASPVAKVPTAETSAKLPAAVNERTSAAMSAASKAPSAPMRSQVAVYGFPSPNSGLIEIINPGLDEAGSVQLIPDRKGVCGWTTSTGPSALVTSDTNAEYARRCRANWTRYARDIAAIVWTRQGPGRVGGFLPNLPQENSRWYSEPVWEEFRGQPHTLVTKSGVRSSRYDLGSMSLSVPNSDMDHDGSAAVEFGGTDCDDSDPNRFPGNVEVPDFEGHDEDCDLRTIGTMDRDHDGFTDARVFNAPDSATGSPVYGDDCDDTRRGINPGVPEIPANGLDDNCDGNVDFDESWRAPTPG